LKDELTKAWKSKKDGGYYEKPLPLPIIDENIALDVIVDKKPMKSGNMLKHVKPHTFDYSSMLNIDCSEKKLDVDVEKKIGKKILNDDSNVGLAKFEKYFKSQVNK
jgi:hypothetical protein